MSWTGTPAIDVAAGVVAQLRDAGVEVRWVPGCSRERDDLYSYRRDGPTGRFAGVVAQERVVTRRSTATASRRDELAARLGEVQARIRAGDGRRRAAPTSRPWSSSPSSSRPPTSTCSPSWASRAIGENRDQEAAAKCAELAHRDRLTVHFIGQLQSNKAASVAHYADVVQSLDRAKVVRALDRARRAGSAAGSTSPCRSTSTRRQGRGRRGAGRRRARSPTWWPARRSLTLRGVMAVAPLGGDPRAAFARLREVRRRHPGRPSRAPPGCPRA